MMNKNFYAKLLRKTLDMLLNRQNLSPSQRRHLQYFLIRDRSLTDTSLRDMLNTQNLNQQQIMDLLWLLQMMKNAPQKRDRHTLLKDVLVEFEGYYHVGVFSEDAYAVRDANEITSHRGEMLLREVGYPANNILDYVRLNLYVYDAHSIINRHALALYRARVARKALERFVQGDFVYHPNASPYLRELYVQARLAETVAMRNLANSRKSATQWKVVEAIREVLYLLDTQALGELEHPDIWRLYLIRDEIRTLSRTNRCTIADIDGLYGRSQTILSRNLHYAEDPIIRYIQMESEIKGFLRVIRSKRQGMKMALQRVQQIPIERIDDLNIGITNKMVVLRALAMFYHRTNDAEAVSYITQKAIQMANDAGLSHQLSLIMADADKFGLK